MRVFLDRRKSFDSRTYVDLRNKDVLRSTCGLDLQQRRSGTAKMWQIGILFNGCWNLVHFSLNLFNETVRIDEKMEWNLLSGMWYMSNNQHCFNKLLGADMGPSNFLKQFWLESSSSIGSLLWRVHARGLKFTKKASNVRCKTFRPVWMLDRTVKPIWKFDNWTYSLRFISDNQNNFKVCILTWIFARTIRPVWKFDIEHSCFFFLCSWGHERSRRFMPKTARFVAKYILDLRKIIGWELCYV